MTLTIEQIKTLKQMKKDCERFIRKIQMKTGLKKIRDAKIIEEIEDKAYYWGESCSEFELSDYFTMDYEAKWVNPENLENYKFGDEHFESKVGAYFRAIIDTILKEPELRKAIIMPLSYFKSFLK